MTCTKGMWFDKPSRAQSYPHLTREDVLAAHSFAAELFKEDTFVAIGKLTA